MKEEAANNSDLKERRYFTGEIRQSLLMSDDLCDCILQWESELESLKYQE